VAEELRQIKGFNNYAVSIDGKVWSERSKKFLKERDTGDGYKRAVLYRSGTPNGRSILIHRLVLLAYIGPCPNGHEADHRDRDRGNNNLSNLRWVTKSKNCIERNTFRFTEKNHPMGKLSELERREIARSQESGPTLSGKYGVSVAHVCRLKKDQRYAA
jgi:hypothetical protein